MNYELTNELVAVNDKQQIVTSSLIVADNFTKEHRNVLRDIERLVMRHKELSEAYLLTNMPDSYGRKRMGYMMTEAGYLALEAKYKYRAVSASLEKAFGKWIDGLFKESEIERQVVVGGYRIDFVIGGSIYIEYDEKEHKHTKESDMKKEDDVLSILFERVVAGQPSLSTTRPEDHFRFIRVQEGNEIEGIRQILLALEEVTWSSPTSFIKENDSTKKNTLKEAN